MWKVGLWIAIPLLLLFSPIARVCAGNPEQGYVLGPADELRIAVFEWRKSVGELHKWDALSGKFVIGPSGAISLPLVGDIEAVGLTTRALARAISDRLQKRVGLAAPADASVEVIRFRPFYVTGSVEKPGAYPYRPGLTVLQAVSIAGGLFRPAYQSYYELSREAISARGDLAVLSGQIDALLARRARLEAEAGEAAALSFPPSLASRQNDPAIAQLMQDEESLFVAQRDLLQMRTAAFTELRDILTREVQTLQQKTVNADKETQLIEAELSTYEKLVRQGLGVNSRELELEQDAAEIASRRLDVNTSLLRAQEAIAGADENLVNLRQKQRQTVLSDLQQTQQKLAQLRAQADTDRRLIYNAEIAGPQMVAEQNRGTAPTYEIVRQTGGQTRELPAQEATAVDPGDTIKVERKEAPQVTAAAPPAGGRVGSPAPPPVIASAPTAALPPAAVASAPPAVPAAAATRAPADPDPDPDYPARDGDVPLPLRKP
jgi:polysaccharide export outer membrane protein/exopolysaccharide production protein ExoF